MRSSAPALLPILRSEHQAKLLAAVLLQPQREHTLTELAHRLGVPLSTLHREVQRLADAGIFSDRTIGRSRLISANAQSQMVKPLTDLLLISYGPLHVIADELGSIEDVDLVLIYGSWAARFHGEPGPPPNDVDVLVVGTPDRGSVYDAAERAGKRLGMLVHPVLCSPGRWAASADALIQEVRASPFEVVIDRTIETEPNQ